MELIYLDSSLFYFANLMKYYSNSQTI